MKILPTYTRVGAFALVCCVMGTNKDVNRLEKEFWDAWSDSGKAEWGHLNTWSFEKRFIHCAEFHEEAYGEKIPDLRKIPLLSESTISISFHSPISKKLGFYKKKIHNVETIHCSFINLPYLYPEKKMKNQNDYFITKKKDRNCLIQIMRKSTRRYYITDEICWKENQANKAPEFPELGILRKISERLSQEIDEESLEDEVQKATKVDSLNQLIGEELENKICKTADIDQKSIEEVSEDKNVINMDMEYLSDEESVIKENVIKEMKREEGKHQLRNLTYQKEEEEVKQNIINVMEVEESENNIEKLANGNVPNFKNGVLSENKENEMKEGIEEKASEREKFINNNVEEKPNEEDEKMEEYEMTDKEEYEFKKEIEASVTKDVGNEFNINKANSFTKYGKAKDKIENNKVLNNHKKEIKSQYERQNLPEFFFKDAKGTKNENGLNEYTVDKREKTIEMNEKFKEEIHAINIEENIVPTRSIEIADRIEGLSDDDESIEESRKGQIINLSDDDGSSDGSVTSKPIENMFSEEWTSSEALKIQYFSNDEKLLADPIICMSSDEY